MNAAPDRVPDEVLDDLRRRLRASRLVQAPGSGWDRGTDHAYLAELVRYWADDYDWRGAEQRIRGLPWERANGMRLLHQRGPAGAPVVVLLHGWPDSVLRFERVLPLLADCTVVVPALPGYPFSDAAGSAGADMADPIAAALAELGYDRYVVSGGDIGSSVADSLARRHADHVAALHLTDVTVRLLATVPEPEWTEETARTARRPTRGRPPAARTPRSTPRGPRRSRPRSVTPPSASPHGSSRSTANGATAAAMSSRCSRAPTS